MEWRKTDDAPMGIQALVYVLGKGIVAAEHDQVWGWRSYPGRYQIYPSHWMPLPAPPTGDER